MDDVLTWENRFKNKNAWQIADQVVAGLCLSADDRMLNELRKEIEYAIIWVKNHDIPDEPAKGLWALRPVRN